MSDIVEQLQKLWVEQETKMTWLQMQAVTDEAADEIELLRGENEKLQAEADYYHSEWQKVIVAISEKHIRVEELEDLQDRLREENERLREAIRPLVAVLVNYADADYDDPEYVVDIFLSVSFRDLLAARKALGETE